MSAPSTSPEVGYILGIGNSGWIATVDSAKLDTLEPSFFFSYGSSKEKARVFGASENVGGLIFFLAAKGYRVIVERVGV